MVLLDDFVEFFLKAVDAVDIGANLGELVVKLLLIVLAQLAPQLEGHVELHNVQGIRVRMLLLVFNLLLVLEGEVLLDLLILALMLLAPCNLLALISALLVPLRVGAIQFVGLGLLRLHETRRRCSGGAYPLLTISVLLHTRLLLHGVFKFLACGP